MLHFNTHMMRITLATGSGGCNDSGDVAAILMRYVTQSLTGRLNNLRQTDGFPDDQQEAISQKEIVFRFRKDI